jgi:hypothetical protein
MTKYLLFLSLLAALSACGQKSVIKPNTSVETFSQNCGDEKCLPLKIFLPIADMDSFKSPIPYIGPVAGGFAKMFGDLGASMGMGRFRMTMKQPLPELPDLVRDVRVKRIFFYIEPTQNQKRNHSIVSRILEGKSDVDFKFLDKIAIKIKPMSFEKIESYAPVTEMVDLDVKTTNKFLDAFKKKDDDQFAAFIDTAVEKEPLILKYDRSKKNIYITNDQYGKVYLVSTSSPASAASVKEFFLNHSKLQGHFTSVHILNNIVFLQLNKDPVYEEDLMAIYNESTYEMDVLGVKQIDACTEQICLDFKVRDVNLLPIMKLSNGIMIDAFINADQVPASFQMKGFVEFEGKIKTPNDV